MMSFVIFYKLFNTIKYKQISTINIRHSKYMPNKMHAFDLEMLA